jgi:hypothetical protein
MDQFGSGTITVLRELLERAIEITRISGDMFHYKMRYRSGD